MSSTSEINAAPLGPKALGPNVPSRNAFSHCSDSPPRPIVNIPEYDLVQMIRVLAGTVGTMPR